MEAGSRRNSPCARDACDRGLGVKGMSLQRKAAMPGHPSIVEGIVRLIANQILDRYLESLDDELVSTNLSDSRRCLIIVCISL